jgi:hypothetical protein
MVATTCDSRTFSSCAMRAEMEGTGNETPVRLTE